jgi:cathepsin F
MLSSGLLVSLCLSLAAASVPVDDKFREFASKFEKTYESEQERLRRFEIFRSNLADIEKLQSSEEGTAIYSHLSPFADLSVEEFSLRLGLKPKPTSVDGPAPLLAPLLDTSDLPDSFDWREKGAVNPVKNQATCGSCWAFATVANIEGAGFVAKKKLLSLSEQELVDCDTKTGDEGCRGGLPSNAYDDMIQNKIGLEQETAYPYKGRGGVCKASSSLEKAFIGGYVNISTDEDQIAAAVMKYGPLAIGINAGPMQWYRGGIAHPWKILCNPKSLDHGVAIVGFGVEKGTKYWIIRNSWGTIWGEKGYYRIVRGTGACGLNTMVTSATNVSFTGSDQEAVVI